MTASPEGQAADASSPRDRHFPFAALHDVNGRCIELLVYAARTHERAPFPLVAQLRDDLRVLRPEARKRAAQRGFLLLDLEFRDPDWWQAVQAHPDRQLRTAAWRGSFERRSGVSLTRGTLMLAWHSIQADRETACVLLGMSRPVADIISKLQFSEIDRIAERRFRHLQPRWHDRPAVWRRLLKVASSDDPTAMRAFNVLGVQLLAGELLDGTVPRA